MSKFSDEQIVKSWHKNVRPWVAAIRDGEIESRLLVTNKAIVDTIVERKPSAVLDVGCGEAWLVRQLCERGIDALGVDVVPEFTVLSEKQGIGRFRILSYEDVSLDKLNETFDVVVCNFSLLGHGSVNHLFQKIPSLLNKGGAFIVQTIHPMFASEEEKYKDGWREGSWSGFSDEFVDPAPWYFRTVESWQALFSENGFASLEIIEPMNPNSKIPASIIFVASID